MIFTKLFDNVFLVTADTKTELAKVFVRMQGCVDSSEFRDKIFSVAEYEKWFMADGKYDLYNAFLGYNIPNYIIDLFDNGNFKNISDDEQWLLDNIKKNKPRGPYYIIGYIKGHIATLKHELAHALYYLNSSYKNEAAIIVRGFTTNTSLDCLGKLSAFFKQLKYNEAIYTDEIHAYLVAAETLKQLNVWDNVAQVSSKNINILFEKYYLKTFGQTIFTTIQNQNA